METERALDGIVKLRGSRGQSTDESAAESEYCNRCGQSQDCFRNGATRLHKALNNYGMANTFEVYKGTHTSVVADRFQNHVLPFFSKNLGSGKDCR